MTQHKNTRIMVVDDDVDGLEVLELRLSHAGYEVETAESAEKALARVAAFDPAMIVTDVRMSGMTGLELLDRGIGIDGDPDPRHPRRAEGRDDLTGPGRVPGHLPVKGEHVRPGVGVGLGELRGIGDHEVNVERPLGGPSYGSDQGRTQGEVGHEVAVHDVQVQPVAAGLLDRLDLGAQVREVRREQRRRDSHGMHRPQYAAAAPPLRTSATPTRVPSGRSSAANTSAPITTQ